MVLHGFMNLAEVPIAPLEHDRPVSGKSNGRVAADVVYPYRLVFQSGVEPVLLGEEGGIDSARIAVIEISGKFDCP